MLPCFHFQNLTCHDALAGEHHDASQAHAEDGALAEVEQRQRAGGLQRRRLVGLQVVVVSLCLVLFIVEVLGDGGGKIEKGRI